MSNDLRPGRDRTLTRKARRTRSFASVADLKEAIDHWAAHWNHDPQPLRCTKTAEPIIASGGLLGRRRLAVWLL